MEETKTAETLATDADHREQPADLEEMFRELEQVIAKMEEGDVTLEQSFELYNKGMELLKKCSRTIDAVEKKVLVLDENGEKHEF